MSHEIRADYEQMDLFPQCLEDWVAGDHPARFIREFVEALDLGELGFEERESEEGRPPYADDLLLKVWLYGYLARIRSTRELEKACREHLSLLWLTGRHAPDHNTLWRFWRDNRRALREVFRAGVKVAAAQGLIGMICHAVDGTKIRAVASRRTVEHREDLEKVLGRVEASIAEMEAAVEAAELETGASTGCRRDCRKRRNCGQAIRESLGKMREAEREHLHPQEPEARLMPCEGRKDPAYNAQAVADAQAGIIVAAEAVNAESDNAQLVPMLEEVQRTWGRWRRRRWRTAGTHRRSSWGRRRRADTKCWWRRESETGGPKRGEYDATKFEYDEAQDEVICPQGQRLKFEGSEE